MYWEEENKVRKVGKMGSPKLFGRSVKRRQSASEHLLKGAVKYMPANLLPPVNAWGGPGKFSRLVDFNLWLMPVCRYWSAEWGKVAGFDLEYLSHVGKIPFFLPLVRSALQVNQHLGTGKWPHFCHHMAAILLLTHISTLPQTSSHILREQLKRRNVAGPSYIQYGPYIKTDLLSATIWQI